MSGADNILDVKRESTDATQTEHADDFGVFGSLTMPDSGYDGSQSSSPGTESEASPINDRMASAIPQRCKIEPKSEGTSPGIAGIYSRHSSESSRDRKFGLGHSDDGDEKPTLRSEIAEADPAYPTEECNICQFSYGPLEITRLGCGHARCNTCLRRTFWLVTRTECTFPAKCCGESIPLLLVAELLSPVQLAAYHATRLRSSAFDQVYCINSKCRAFIPREHRNCGYATCPTCQTAFHQGDCQGMPDAPSDESLIEPKGWARCYRCRDLVERQFGNCNYMQ
jgi:hypothetical protein